MKVIITLILILSFFFVSKKTSFAQSIELAGTYTTSDANFYKNTPGVSFAYSHHFKKQFVFVEFKAAKKGNNSFTSFDYTVSEYYRIVSTQGSFSTSSVNVGAAQKIVTSNCLDFSVGADAGLNYYKQDNEVISIGLDKERNEIIYFNTSNETEKRKNKFGIGAFIDIELKRIFFDNLSIFSKLNIYHSDYIDKPVLRNDVPKTSSINSISFRIGIKYRIPTTKD
jgi:hypothetical protein